MSSNDDNKSHPAMNINVFLEKQRILLNMEREEELEQEALRLEGNQLTIKELERRGHVLTRLFIADVEAGLYGRVLVRLRRFKGESNIADKSTFRMKDIVGLRTSNESINAELATLSGIVHSIKQEVLTVAFESFPAELQNLKNVRLVRLGNDVTFTRHMKTLDILSSLDSKSDLPCRKIMDVLFLKEEPLFSKTIPPIESFPEHQLNECQIKAVTQSLRSQDVHLVHGPPGTGKTTTVIDIIRRAVLRGESVLACAPSNIAVDNMVERLDLLGIECVRLGHPARIIESVLKHSLDAKVRKSDSAKIVNTIRLEMTQILRKFSKKTTHAEKRELRTELNFLRKEIMLRESAAIDEVLNQSQVILSTCNGVSSRSIKSRTFDLVVIDEAGQALEIECHNALLKGKRCIMAGDHCQLPPTIISDKASMEGLGITLFDRCVTTLNDEAVSMLTKQYRMHDMIMQWSSHEFYQGRLEADNSVAKHLLVDLPDIKETEDTTFPFVVIDTVGFQLFEDEASSEHESISNQGEASLVCTHVKSLVASGLHPSNIAVITPYKAQVSLIKMMLDKLPGLEIGTVDGFQGREKEAVVISMVRSNSSREVGFLKESRRTNVAITRARRHVCIIMDSETISSDLLLKRMVEYTLENADYRSPDAVVTMGEADDFKRKVPDVIVTQLVASKEQDEKNVISANKKEKQKNKKKISIKQKKDEGELISETGPETIDVDIIGQKRQVELTEQGINNLLDYLLYLGKNQEVKVCMPTTLNAFQRMMLHRTADKRKNMSHKSEGEGKDRFIVLMCDKVKVESEPEPEPPIIKSKHKLQSEEPKSAKTEEEEEQQQPTKQSYDVRPSFTALVDDDTSGEEEIVQIEQKKTTKKPKRKKKKKKPTDETKKNDMDMDMDDLDAVLAQFRIGKCKVDKCKEKVRSGGGFICKYCNENFCYTHMNPIFHGCEQERKQERMKMAQSALNPQKKFSVHQKKLLEKKLREKTTARSKPINLKKKK